MTAYIYMVASFGLLLTGYLSWISRHFFTFGASRWERDCPLTHKREYRIQLLIHNKERVPLIGEHLISFRPSEGGRLHLGDAAIYCGNARVRSSIAHSKCWEIEFMRFPPEDTWAFEFSVDSDAPVRVDVRPVASAKHPLARIVSGIGQNKMQIKSGVFVDFFPNNHRPTIFACATIAGLSLLLYGLLLYGLILATRSFGGHWYNGEADLIGIFGVGLFLGLALFVVLLGLREPPAPVSRAYSVASNHELALAHAYEGNVKESPKAAE
ncbi:MAG: hypothetical protein H7A19_07285 [Rhodanobacteraceae bacterium]|nr:hypothetical protein [Rhodanobacteraceae bacterium]